jgi:UDP-N-acetylglucosamine diphosphorylase / glucose-1-phosphate thymidylyltransferase / UDP-N-acetylgalactosamine diphosphorylase / glucosamine-1-phosphate N-acetyltransferase / galactosamine-1-phosphate N-acetyltransferase
MPTIIFTEDNCGRENLYPFTLTRCIADIRLGILTLRQKWERLLSMPAINLQQKNYLDTGTAIALAPGMAAGAYLLIRANVVATAALAKQVKKLGAGQCLIDTAGTVIALAFTADQVLKGGKIKVGRTVVAQGEIQLLEYAWQIFYWNDAALLADFDLLTKGRKTAPIAKTNRCTNTRNIFIEPGAQVQHSVLNAEAGPIYIGKNALVMEGCLIRGGFAMGEGAVLKMGAQVYGATTLGPYCTVGGEIKNSVLFGYSNKAHHGYLGDSVIGEWCNLGAGTTNSNIKNNAGAVSYILGSGQSIGGPGNKGGLLMGDHSKAAINTAFNTGTVVGVCCNVFGSGLSPAHIPSFSWGMQGKVRYQFPKALADMDEWKKLKGGSLSEAEKKQLKHIFDHH